MMQRNSKTMHQNIRFKARFSSRIVLFSSESAFLFRLLAMFDEKMAFSTLFGVHSTLFRCTSRLGG